MIANDSIYKLVDLKRQYPWKFDQKSWLDNEIKEPRKWYIKNHAKSLSFIIYDAKKINYTLVIQTNTFIDCSDQNFEDRCCIHCPWTSNTKSEDVIHASIEFKAVRSGNSNTAVAQWNIKEYPHAQLFTSNGQMKQLKITYLPKVQHSCVKNN